ncbi:NepR family anti-sigma factor [Aquabacter sp. CN5-332]|uniref:NepR family anti-sigma factor n=1 Tax=Aquabacter sp. CN5-332 TaxID=3156608 RepID=UPI0032B48B82
MTQDQKEGGAMRAPHRRDISARQDLLGKELRQLFDDYTSEDVPDELMKLALQLQGAFEKSSGDATTRRDANGQGPEGDAAEQTLQGRSE